MTIQPVVNWDVEVVLYINSIRGADFEWGKTDCLSVVRGTLIKIYGEDLWAGLGSWDSIRVVKNLNDVVDIPSFLVDTGARLVDSVQFLRTGDIGVVPADDDGLPSILVVTPSRRILTSSQETGVVLLNSFSFNDDVAWWRYGP